nr:hypothetical protein [uncultured Butyrivibrio sp.]
MTESRFQRLIEKKDVIYITVKNADYIRTSQIVRLLEETAASFKMYSSEKSNPLTRALELRRRISEIPFEDADVVILGFLPQLIWGKALRQIRKKQTQRGNKPILIADMFLSVYDTVVQDRRLVSKNGLLARLCRTLDSKVVSEADLIITDTRADGDYFAREFSGEKSKFEPLYLKALSITFPDKNISTIEKSVLYFGTGLPLQGTDVVLKAFKVLSEEHGYKCIFIGGLKGLNAEQKAFAHNGTIEYHDWLPLQELYAKIAQVSICLAGHFNPDIDKADRTIPGKAMIYEELGKKMILGDTKANHELFVEDDRHFFVPRGDVEQIVEAVLKI